MTDLAECGVDPIGRCADCDRSRDLETVRRDELDLCCGRNGDGQGLE